MANPKFVWIIRSWSSEDTFWEHVREHKEYDIAYRKTELLLEEINRIILKEQMDWEDMCEASGTSKDTRQIQHEVPTLDQLKTRPFYKFLTITNTPGDFMQSWYVERLKIADN
jgi:hypothetical protein